MSELSKKTVLVIDDDASITTVASAILEFLGYAVELASNDIEAIECIKTKQIDMVILDWNIPDVDTNAIKNDIRERSNVPIILSTGLTPGQTEDIEEEFDGMLSKPYSAQDMKALLNSVLK